MGAFDEINDRWMHYSNHLAPGQCAPEYMDWFFIISHPFMTATQSLDQLRDAPVTHDASFVEPHIPQVPKPASILTHARSDVEQPIHAVVSVTIFLVVSNVIYVNYFNTNLSNLFVF